MKRAVILACVALSACNTITPQALAVRVPANDPAASSSACQLAKEDALHFDEEVGKRLAKGVGLGFLGPWGMVKANSIDERKSAERERYNEAVRGACHTIPPLERAEAVPGQRWPRGERYDRQLVAVHNAYGRSVVAFLHPTVNTIWMKPGRGERGAQFWPANAWLVTADHLLGDTGCKISQDHMTQPYTWEVAYVCPPGVSLVALWKAQAPSLRDGAQLHR